MDIEWDNLLGGYRVPYDPRVAISNIEIESSDNESWNELFDNLYHQGDLGVASYASIPRLVDIFSNKPRVGEFYTLIAVVESQRYRTTNPSVPAWLADSYTKSIQSAKSLALIDLGSCKDEQTIRSSLAVVALASGDHALGILISLADDSDIAEILGDLSGDIFSLPERPSA